MPTPIPATPGDLTAGWLTGVLRDAGVIDDARVARVDARIIGEETGFTGVVARLRLRYDRSASGAPEMLVAKFPLASPASASTYRAAQGANPEQARRFRERCAREVAFYRVIAPRGAPAPRAYAALADADASRLLLLLEDLSEGEQGDALRGCTVAQAQAVIEGMAAFHARWWARPELDELGWLPRWASDPADNAARYQGQVGPVLERYGDRLPLAVQELTRMLPDRYAALLNALNGPPATLIHADLHLDNVIFTPANPARPATIIDWQGVVRGVGTLDIGSFIAGALAVADRRAAERQLLARYHGLLLAGGVRGYDEDRLLRDYRLALLWQLGGTLGWLARADPATLAGRERALVEAIFAPGRLFATLEDHADELEHELRRA